MSLSGFLPLGLAGVPCAHSALSQPLFIYITPVMLHKRQRNAAKCFSAAFISRHEHRRLRLALCSAVTETSRCLQWNRPRCCRRHKRSVITSELTPLQRTEGTSVPPGSLWSHGWNSVLLLENWARTEHPHVSAQRVHVHMCSCCESHVNTGTINVTSRKSLKTRRQDILWN